MKRFKKPKKNNNQSTKISKHLIFKVIMPCVMLACKDEFKIKDDAKGQARLDNVSKLAQHYIDLVTSGNVTEQQLEQLMTIDDSVKAMNYLEKISGGNTYEKCQK